MRSGGQEPKYSAGNLLSCMMEASIMSEVEGRFVMRDVLGMMA